MKCIRCGFCCVQFDVIIVKPEHVNDFDPDDFDQDHKLMHKKGGEICPHLKIDKENKITTCTVHNKLWYPGTPCDTHYVFGDPEKPCRVGEYCFQNGWILTKEDLPNVKERSRCD